MNSFLIANFAKAYRINVEEAEKGIDDYTSLGEFFVRKLKLGRRPVGQTWAVHPADAVITQAAPIQEGQLIQAKNKTYHLTGFTQDQQAIQKYNEGHFLTYYLCPTDYHRVHSPVDGEIKRVVLIPGALWPVNQWSTDNIHELFSVNERVLVEILTERGLVGVMFVGATNVGQICLSFDSEIRGNQLLSNAVLEKKYNQLSVKKGDELGMFRMGSTVVMLYAKGCLHNFNPSQFQQLQSRVNADFSS